MDMFTMALFSAAKRGKASGGVQPDWNQNNPKAADYVKNRPFWTGAPVETVLIEETTNEWTNVEEPIPIAQAEIVAGDTYIVKFDGVRYECTAYVASGPEFPTIGDGSLGGIGNEGSNGEPFAFVYVGGNVFASAAEAGTHTLSVTHIVGEVHKIDAKYLPDTVVCADAAKRVKHIVELRHILDIPYWHDENEEMTFDCTTEQWQDLMRTVNACGIESEFFVCGADKIAQSASTTNGQVRLSFFNLWEGVGDSLELRFLKTVLTFNEDEQTVTGTYTLKTKLVD